jgi:hypothetical protein
VKLARLLLVVAFMALTCSLAFADDAQDPVFKIGTGSKSVVLTSDSFSFTLAKGTTGAVTFDFINFTGALISELDLSAPAGFTYSCDNTGDPYFNTCSPTTTTQGQATILKFFGLDGNHLGIPFATKVSGDCDNDEEDDRPGDENSCTPDVALSDFTVTVNVGSTGLGSALTIGGDLVPAAEPSVLVLLLAAGMGFLAIKRFGFSV